MQPAEMLAKWQTHMLVYKQSEGTILFLIVILMDHGPPRTLKNPENACECESKKNVLLVCEHYRMVCEHIRSLCL